MSNQDCQCWQQSPIPHHCLLNISGKKKKKNSNIKLLQLLLCVCISMCVFGVSVVGVVNKSLAGKPDKEVIQPNQCKITSVAMPKTDMSAPLSGDASV